MDIEDLRKFLTIADLNNLQQSAEHLNMTPGALSKVVKRVESEIGQPLFARSGRSISLNSDGERFRIHARQLVFESDQILSEFGQSQRATKVMIAGPSVLLQKYAVELLTELGSDTITLHTSSQWEEDALTTLKNGHCHFAITTNLGDRIAQEGFETVELGTTTFKVVASPEHPLFKQYPEGKLSSAELLQFGFACPSVNLFGGNKRGIGSDGWRDDAMPRKIQFRCDDYSVLLSLVKSGQAIAYVPDYFLDHEPIRPLDVYDCAYTCEEEIKLVYQPSQAAGWQNRLIRSISN